MSNPTWKEFLQKFEDEVLVSKSQNTFNTTTSVLNRVEDIANPERLRHLTSDRLEGFVRALREEKKAAETIRTYLKNLFWALRWAKRKGMLAKLPTVEIPRGDDSEDEPMKGRPITTEEFERMIAGMPKAFKPKGDKQQQRYAAMVAPAWRFYLLGMWWSGLRLQESLNLWWDREDRIHLDLKAGMMIIPKGMQKNKKSTLHPIVPEFIELLESVPEGERTGPVFKLPAMLRDRNCRKKDWVGRVVARIGKAANVVVERAASGRVKWASAHDLRRSFGERWSHRLFPKELKEVMRHSRIETTMRYYVGRNAEKTANAMRAAYERSKVSIEVNTPQNQEVPTK